jgi:actin-related protein
MKDKLYGEEYQYLDPKLKDNYKVTNLTMGDYKTPLNYLECGEFLRELIDNRLGVTITDYSAIVTGCPIKNKNNITHPVQNNIAKMLMEDLLFKSFAMINTSSLSLFATGRTTGLVVECGESMTYVSPIYEGFPLYHALNKTKLAGKDLTKIFTDGINENQIKVNVEDLISVRKIKEKMSAVPLDYKRVLETNQDIISDAKMLYKLPDETIISIPKNVRLKAGEILFNPSIIGSEEKGLIYLIADSLNKTYIDDNDLKKTMFGNIVLSGGTTMMSGFSNRIYKELPSHLGQFYYDNSNSRSDL